MKQPVSYKRHRYPPQIIAHAVWLYFRFPLSLRLVEELLAERGLGARMPLLGVVTVTFAEEGLA
jgi:transposase-like protein